MSESETDHRHQILADDTTVYVVRGTTSNPRLHKIDNCPRINTGANIKDTTAGVRCNSKLCNDCWGDEQ